MDALTIRGVLTLDKSQYDKGLTDAGKSASSFGGRLSKVMKVGAVATAALGTATAVMGKKFVNSAKATAEYGDKVDKMSQKIGISAEAYQKWDYVMQRAGGNVDSLKMGMKTLSAQAEKNSDAFQKLGISQEEVSELSKEELFEETVKGLSKMEDSTERTALASQLLGRAGADMGPLLNQGTEAIEEQMEIAEKYGMIMPDSAVKASAAFEDSVTTMQMTMQGMRNRMMGEFLPALTQVTDGLGKLFAGDMSGTKDIEKGLDNLIKKLGKVIPKALAIGGDIIKSLATSLISRLPDLAATATQLIIGFVQYVIQSLPQIITAGVGMITALVSGISQALPDLIPAAVDAVVQLAGALVQNIPILIGAAVQLGLAIVKGILRVIPQIVSAGRNAISGLIKGIKSKIGSAVDVVRNAISTMRERITSGLTKAKDSAVRIFQTIKDKISEKIQAAKDKVKEVIDKIKGMFPFSLGKLFTFQTPEIDVGEKSTTAGGKTQKVPTFSTRWHGHASALNTPYLFSKPTVFDMHYAGESGDEMLYGKSALMGDIKKAVGDTRSVVINNSFNINGAENPNFITEQIVRSIELQLRTA